MPNRPVPTVLTIAGSDSGGGAGIQADLKALAACGVHGMTAITALTAQSTTGVTGVHPVPADFIVQQVRTVAEDLGVDAVKTGMLGTAETVAAVVEALDLLPDGVPLVVDPVMVAESGATLLDEPARRAVVERLLPRATVITPNLPEARALLEVAGVTPPDDAEGLARALHDLGPQVVVVTGGHREEATDVVFDGEAITLAPGDRHPDGAAHGSGCTHASALAAHLALGVDPINAARRAKAIAAQAVRDGLRGLGRGPGPVDVLGIAHQAPDLAAPVPEAPIETTEHGLRPQGEGWYVINLADVPAYVAEGAGESCDLEPPTAEWRQYGVNVHVLGPGEPNGLYHSETEQEDFLVLFGEPLLIIEEQERRLKPWDLVHCPPGAKHIFVGAGDGPSAILMAGGRRPAYRLLYPASEVAARHGASARETTPYNKDAYGGVGWPGWTTRRFPWPPPGV